MNKAAATRGLLCGVCLVVMLAVGSGPAAWAQAPPRSLEARPRPRPGTLYVPTAEDLQGVEIGEALEACLERLGDPVYATREVATAELFTGSFANEQFYAVLARRPLTAEQRHRLLMVLRDRLLRTPRGAVGIRVDQRFIPDKIVILELLPDLPAREVLQIGDRITHLQGRPLTSWEAFVEAVQTRVPGSKIAVTVERPVSGRRPRREVAAEAPKYETLEIQLELGSAELLLDPASGRTQTGGPVMRRRQLEADDAVEQFGSHPRRVEIEK